MEDPAATAALARAAVSSNCSARVIEIRTPPAFRLGRDDRRLHTYTSSFSLVAFLPRYMLSSCVSAGPYVRHVCNWYQVSISNRFRDIGI